MDQSIYRARDKPPADTNRVLARNIRTLLDRAQAEDRAAGWSERVAAGVTTFTGSMKFVLIHGLLVLSWVAVNLGLTPLPRFDPTFVILATVASVEAIFLSTFVLISQNRMGALAEKRAQLDLQISLLAEHEITQVLQLVAAIAERHGVDTARDPAVEESKQDVAPEKVLERIEAETRLHEPTRRSP